ELRRRLVEERLQGALARHVAFRTPQVTGGVGQVARQDLPQPGGLFGDAAKLELSQCLVRFEEGLLDDVGGVELASQACVESGASQEEQIVAKPLQRQNPGRSRIAHGGPLWI